MYECEQVIANQKDDVEIKELFTTLKKINSEKKSNNIFTLLYKHNPMKKTMFLTDHWYIDVPQLDIEMHYGYDDRISFKNSNSIKSFHVYSEIYLCNDCMLTFLETSYNERMPWLQPFINCESLSSQMISNIGISFQVFFLTFFIMFIILSIFNLFYIFMIPVTVLMYFFYVKRNYSATYYQCCNHLHHLHA